MATYNLDEPPPLTHLRRLTTKRGLVQHCRGSEPDLRHGYSIDDNARGLIVTYKYGELFDTKPVLPLTKIYLNYIKRSQLKNGLFHNFADAKGQFLDDKGSHDSIGRTFWGLGYAAGHMQFNEKLSLKAQEAMKQWRLNLKFLRFSRSKAFALAGFYYIKEKLVAERIADSLVKQYSENASENWHWYENTLTYSNAILPYSLFLAYELIKKPIYLKVATESLAFLQRKCAVNGVPAPIGQDGWYEKDKKKAIFDQQVIDATDMILASVKAYQITKKSHYKKWAWEWWRWFHGNNLLGKPFFDAITGGCYDGLRPNGFNTNEGAESIVCYLLAYLTMVDLVNGDKEGK